MLAAILSFAAVAVIAVPTRLVPNDYFRRMTPTRPLDYVLLVLTAPLVGMTASIALRRRDGREKAAAGSAFVTTLAVGCPICNRVVVALLGVSGALSIWAPLQPLLGFSAIAVLLYTLRRQLSSDAACAVSRDVRS